jgi:hypothetical protein
VSFEADGLTDGSYTSISTVRHGSNFVLFIDTLPGAACTLSAPSHTAINLGTAPIDGSTPAFIARWGGGGSQGPWWAVGNYTVTARCTLSGYAPVSADKIVHITH